MYITCYITLGTYEQKVYIFDEQGTAHHLILSSTKNLISTFESLSEKFNTKKIRLGGIKSFNKKIKEELEILGYDVEELDGD